MKLTGVARASLEELKRDYEDFLRHKRLTLWPREDPRRQSLIDLRPKTADEVAQWVKKIYQNSGQSGHGGQTNEHEHSTLSTPSTLPTYPEIAANAALALIAVATALLDRQLEAQAKAFETEGGFTERLYRQRQKKRGEP